MRCLHHVFLRGGFALFLLASAGVGAWSLSAACHATQAATESPTPRASC